MCGICGIYEKNKNNRELIAKMSAMLAHRGPDKSSTYISGNTSLGHQRLSIIDLATGDQPIFNSDKTLAIIYNGEIYNYRELRDELLKNGQKFNTNSDTEVILKMYENKGANSFCKLNGIFAFAILDVRHGAEKLILARDHFGIKPLHYHSRNDRFVFASEQKAILLHPAVSRTLSRQSLHHQLNLRYTQAFETLFKDIYRLPPAHFMIVENGKIKKIAAYYKLNYTIDESKTERQWLEEIPFYLKQAVKRQLVSDVPIGVYLSGGMDSSSIVAMMRESGVDNINTFTLGFNEPTDEIDDAQIVADHFGTKHQSLHMDLNPMALMPQVIWHAEEPKINLLQGFLMSKFVSEHVKVVLGGLGGDELFSGYDIHRFIYPFNKLHEFIPGKIEKQILSRISSMSFKIQSRLGSFNTDEYRRGFQMALSTGNIAKFYLILRNVWDFDGEQWKYIYTSKYLNHQIKPVIKEFSDYFSKNGNLTALDKVYWTELNSKMVNDYLLTEDRMSMSHSVEERVPFLDLDLVEFAFSIPAKMKMRSNQTKYLLRKAIQRFLPEQILKKKKWGFTFNPYLQYQKDLKTTAERILTKERIEKDGIFNYEYIKSIFDARPNPRMRWHYNFIWILTGFYIWKQMFLETDNFCNKRFEIEDYYQ
jgi:asparagine synthase (glutamine-hydrolysing)